MMLVNKLGIGGIVLAGAIGLSANFGETYKTGCETYQDSADGERIFIFHSLLTTKKNRILQKRCKYQCAKILVLK